MSNDLSISIFSEIIAIDQRVRTRIGKALPKGLELSHFSVLNHLYATTGECTPAQLASALNVSRGAITNTLSKLETNGLIHIRGDWDDARKKYVSLTQTGKFAREMAVNSVAPIFKEATETIDPIELKALLSALRGLRLLLD